MSNVPVKLTKKLKEFLTERRESDGGWAPVTQKDMEQLYEVMYAVVDAKWGADCDGDRPINFQIIDRTRYEPQHFREIPYRHHSDGFENKAAVEAWNATIFETCISNAKVAMDRLDTESRIEEDHRYERQGANATFREEDNLVCIAVMAGDEDKLMVGHLYEAYNYSYWRGDVEMIGVKLNDENERYNSYPVSCFKKKD